MGTSQNSSDWGSAADRVLQPGEDNEGFQPEDDQPRKNSKFGHKSTLDHTPHELFVTLDELQGATWVEKARWIKYEEELEPENGQWGKPHISQLSFQAVVNLRLCLEKCSMLLDLPANNYAAVINKVMDSFTLNLKVKAILRKNLLMRDKNLRKKSFKFGAVVDELMSDKAKMEKMKEQNENLLRAAGKEGNDSKNNKLAWISGKGPNDQVTLNMSGASKAKPLEGMFACMEDGSESSIILVGSISELEEPVVSFIRLENPIPVPQAPEQPNSRFIFIVFTPTKNTEFDPLEIGRSMATLLSNEDFKKSAYLAEGKEKLFVGLKDFLEQSILLPPGDWDRRSLLPMSQMMDMKKKQKLRKDACVENGDNSNKNKQNIQSKKVKEQVVKEKPARNPLKRTKLPFGGLIDDIKYRYKVYLSDIKDGLNAQCVAATIFIYFAALSGAIAFGGLMGSSTDNLIGISETLIISSVGGLIFALFSGSPLIITGVTGPVLLYDQALFSFCTNIEGLQFLPWRLWVGVWTLVIALLVAAFQGSTLVRFFTRFTKDIFNALVALLFIVSAFEKLGKIFAAHPLSETTDYCEALPKPCLEDIIISKMNSSTCSLTENPKSQPNTALLSMFLMLGTFFIAYFLRIFRTSQYFGKTARKAMGDFGVPIAIVIMVLVDFSAGDTYTEKLSVPEGLTTTIPGRGWLISPTGTADNPLAIWAIFIAILPAILLYLLLFMETHICELIMMEKTKEKKGAGLHLDIVLLSLINFGSGILGGPWICAATVRAVSHVSALTVMSTTSAPGEAPKVVGVRDQRVTAAMVSILLGVSVAMAPALKLVPFAVLFGVFLYMGVSGMNGVQFFDRVALCFMPKKHHPNVSYVQKVRTWRMVLFTLLQAAGLAVLWTVKSIKAIALAFPFFVVLMIPYRMLLKYIFTEEELDMLDGAQAGKNLSGEKDDEDDDVDFYASAADCPITPETVAPLHRAMMGLLHSSTVLAFDLQNIPKD